MISKAHCIYLNTITQEKLIGQLDDERLLADPPTLLRFALLGVPVFVSKFVPDGHAFVQGIGADGNPTLEDMEA